MDDEFFSSTLKKFKPSIPNPYLANSLEDLKRILGVKALDYLVWDENIIAVPIDIYVELPPHGTFGNIDIRNVEPILLLFNINNYPFEAPKVCSNRIDFPQDSLAHLNISQSNKPATFCLVRGNSDEWYSGKRLNDLILRTSNWLRDAAAGILSENGNQFEPIRLEGYFGSIIYDYNELALIVNENNLCLPGNNFSSCILKVRINEDSLSIILSKWITPENSDKVLKEIKQEIESEKLNLKKNYFLGHLIWPQNQNVYNKYFAKLPKNWGELKEFAKQYGIDLKRLEEYLCKHQCNDFVSIIVAIRRPKNLIGFSSSIEFVNFFFRIDENNIINGAISDNLIISFQAHIQPLTIAKANEISGFRAEFEGESLVVGCGALGSKIIMHLAKSGSTRLTLSDADYMSPHNFVRHSLSVNSIGLNKAEALANEIRRMFAFEKADLNIRHAKERGEFLLMRDSVKKYKWVFDFAASNAFTAKLIKVTLQKESRVCKAIISNFGNLGIIMFEGNERNPRLDDLEVLLYDSYQNNPYISEWLRREFKSDVTSNLSITVGVGCNSETTMLSDDIVSLHASCFSGIIKSDSQKVNSEKGKIYLNEIRYEPIFFNKLNFIEFVRLDVFKAKNDPTWQIRIKSGIIEKLRETMKIFMPNEIGGLFIGRANYKTKTIHVVDLLDAPPDSRSNSFSFLRGIVGLPESVQNINEATGGQLGYIGEWHTHPKGPDGLSTVDRNTILKFRNSINISQTSLPIFLIIVTPTQILPYVF